MPKFILSLIVWVPAAVGIFMFLMNRYSFCRNLLKLLALSVSFFSLYLLAILCINFKFDTWQMQAVERTLWLPDLGVEYAIGVDGFSLPLLILNAFMTLIVLVVANKHVKTEEQVSYAATFLLLQSCISGVFVAVDAVLFYVFFEAMMIPMFLLIGLWGGINRVYASIKFVLYTCLGSLLFLLAIIYLHHIASSSVDAGSQSFAITSFYDLNLNFIQQKILFWAMLVAFAVKIPMWPLHTWLPDAHVEAPTGGSVILAAITLKVGAYAMLRFLLPITPQACVLYAPVVIALSLIAVIYISLIAMRQTDMKRLIAYSSIAHMGFVTLGMFAVFKIISKDNDLSAIKMAITGIEGAMLQMISHGFISAALFLCVGVLYHRMHSREISDYGGVVNTMPIFSSFLMLFSLANVGLPGTSGFIGEFFVLMASFKAGVWYAFGAASILVLGLCYTFYMYKRVVFGEIANKAVAGLRDLYFEEKLVFYLLGAAILLVGIWPKYLLEMMHGTTAHLIDKLVLIK